MIIQHPNERSYPDVAFFSGVGTHKDVLMLEAPKINNSQGREEPLNKGMVEEVNENYFEDFGQDDGSIKMEAGKKKQPEFQLPRSN